MSLFRGAVFCADRTSSNVSRGVPAPQSGARPVSGPNVTANARRIRTAGAAVRARRTGAQAARAAIRRVVAHVRASKIPAHASPALEHAKVRPVVKALERTASEAAARAALAVVAVLEQRRAVRRVLQGRQAVVLQVLAEPQVPEAVVAVGKSKCT